MGPAARFPPTRPLFPSWRRRQPQPAALQPGLRHTVTHLAPVRRGARRGGRRRVHDGRGRSSGCWGRPTRRILKQRFKDADAPRPAGRGRDRLPLGHDHQRFPLVHEQLDDPVDLVSVHQRRFQDSSSRASTIEMNFSNQPTITPAVRTASGKSAFRSPRAYSSGVTTSTASTRNIRKLPST